MYNNADYLYSIGNMMKGVGFCGSVTPKLPVWLRRRHDRSQIADVCLFPPVPYAEISALLTARPHLNEKEKQHT